mmetsp:Transcript_42913/g.96398  ORF Transcript_42913/g.96398 Transcript_42913/m.96398 type:complete len:283 (-) Transcript_42913:12-860(-)
MDGAAADAAESFFASLKAGKPAASTEAEVGAAAAEAPAADAVPEPTASGAAQPAENPTAADDEPPEGAGAEMSGAAADAADSLFAAMRAERKAENGDEAKPMANDVADAADAFFAAMRGGGGATAGQSSSSSALPMAVDEPIDESLPRALKGFVVESAAMQGRPEKQLDKKAIVPDLAKAAKLMKMPIDHLDQPSALYAIYDGFRGLQCVEFIAKQFHTRLLKKLSANTDAASWTDEAVSECLKGVFEELDSDFLAKFRTSNDGATAVVVLVLGSRVFVAWL